MRDLAADIANLILIFGAIAVLLWLPVAIVLLTTRFRRPGFVMARIPRLQAQASTAAERRINEAKNTLTAHGIAHPANNAVWPRAALRDWHFARYGVFCIQFVSTVLVWALSATVTGMILTSDARPRTQLAASAACIALGSFGLATLVLDRKAGERGRSEAYQYDALVSLLADVRPESSPATTAQIGRCNQLAERLTGAMVRHAYFGSRTIGHQREIYVAEAARAGAFVTEALDQVRRGNATLDTVPAAGLKLMEQMARGLPLNLVPAGANPTPAPVILPRTPSWARIIAYAVLALFGATGLIVLAVAGVDSHVADIVSAAVVAALSILPVFAIARRSSNTP